jgi:hypothetical protein
VTAQLKERKRKQHQGMISSPHFQSSNPSHLMPVRQYTPNRSALINLSISQLTKTPHTNPEPSPLSPNNYAEFSSQNLHNTTAYPHPFRTYWRRKEERNPKASLAHVHVLSIKKNKSDIKWVYNKVCKRPLSRACVWLTRLRRLTKKKPLWNA